MPGPAVLKSLTQVSERAALTLLGQRDSRGVWVGELSASALSTATAAVAIELVRQGTQRSDAEVLARYVERAIAWLAAHQNPDGGWGDTTRSQSNISTTCLAFAAFHATGSLEKYATCVAAASNWLDRAGGLAAVPARYGRDRTFSIPILTHCALSGLVAWSRVPPLPFELACVPASLYRFLRLPVVSYALPALIAVGQVRFHNAPPRNPIARLVRRMAAPPSLALLERLQPTGGGFLEAAPLTSFVTMSLAGMGHAGHAVAQRGIEFLVRSVRPDGSWPIDTNLSTWVTTLAINALGETLPAEERQPLIGWLLDQQHVVRHPYTQAEPGGWAWTDLSGGVPDADDTPGAILALMTLGAHHEPRAAAAIALAVNWLVSLQNRNGGWPTFCRGWGTLAFDRSAPDITAHVLRALGKAASHAHSALPGRARRQMARAVSRGFAYLARVQRSDGAWLPLWFGNEHVPDDENPVYGTSRVLAAYDESGRSGEPAACRARDWLAGMQNRDGGWGGASGAPSTVEETSLALEALLRFANREALEGGTVARGLDWLVSAGDRPESTIASPIGFYFAKLWYSEKLYPLIFRVAALRRAACVLAAPCPAS